MVETLKAALAWAKRGFRIFPIQANGRYPIFDAFMDHATTDTEIINYWWHDPVTGQEKQYNIGVSTNDMVVVDIDVKHNKPGLETFKLYSGDFNTLVIQTPSGGFHCYYNGPDSGMSPLGPGLDVRSHNGYVLGPGSEVDGKLYKVLYDLPMAWVPLPMERRLRPPGERSSRESFAIELDRPLSLASAEEWLEHMAPVAIEGQLGDNTTYQVACKLVRDFALSEETAFELLIRHWNDRCQPPWDQDELLAKVSHAYDYGKASLGIALPEMIFGQVHVPKPIVLNGTPSDFGNAMPIETVPPRPWLMKRLLMRGAVTTLIADGSVGKSTLALVIAVHLVLGLPLGNNETVMPCKCIVYNGEDDLQEQSRRLFAICMDYKLDYATVRNRVKLITKTPTPVSIAHRVNRDLVANYTHVQQLIDMAKDRDVGFLVLDPLIGIHNVNENDNTDMKFVYSVLEHIAEAADVSILVNHHTPKGSQGDENRAGNPAISRGAGSIITSSRIALTLTNADDRDRLHYGIAEQDRFRYVRLDDAKGNYSMKSGISTWFARTGVTLMNGDVVGSLHVYNMMANADRQRNQMAEICSQALYASKAGEISIQQAVKAMKMADSLYAKMSDAAVRDRLEQTLGTPAVLADGYSVGVVRELRSGRDHIVVRLV